MLHFRHFSILCYWALCIYLSTSLRTFILQPSFPWRWSS